MNRSELIEHFATDHQCNFGESMLDSTDESLWDSHNAMHNMSQQYPEIVGAETHTHSDLEYVDIHIINNFDDLPYDEGNIQ